MTASATTRERLAEFIDSDYARVVAAVAFHTGDRVRAEDAVQDAIVKTLAGDASPENLAGWITVVAINYIRQSWRRASAQSRAYIKAVTWDDDTDEESEHLVDTLAVREALEHLPERQRLTMALHYLGGLSVDQVGETLGVSAGTVKTQLSRGRHALADELGMGVA